MDAIKDNLLTYRMKALAQLIGLPALLTLVELRGGREITVPIHASESHWLAEHIGIDNLKKLSKEYGGELLSIGQCQLLKTAIKAEAILADANAGMSNAQLAKKYAMTKRNVINLKNAAKARATHGKT